MNPETIKLGSKLDFPLELSRPKNYLHGLCAILEQLPVEAVEEVVERFFQAYLQGRSIYVFGNGGSAALASHAACDLGKGTALNGNPRFRILSLTDNVALITAWANDVAYEDVFAAQIKPLIEPGDIALAISGSGNSANVLKALSVSRDAGGINVGLSGCRGGKMKDLCDLCVIVPSDNMQQIEDSHVCVMHAVFLSLRHLIGTTGSSLSASAGA
ncbi:MAG TPA: SIS domain-containing protein [Terriglobales bacterium]|nr:SIS domain-containing protein [Terriglobales bacterium]